jgi:hypothetical protein
MAPTAAPKPHHNAALGRLGNDARPTETISDDDRAFLDRVAATYFWAVTT